MPHLSIVPNRIRRRPISSFTGGGPGVAGSEFVPLAYLDPDGALAANSDSRIATQKATKTYVDSQRSVNQGQWRFDDTLTTMADPGSGKVRGNNASVASMTAIALSALTWDNVDVSRFLRALSTNDGLYIQDRDDSTVWVRFSLSAPPIDHTTWFELPVTYINNEGGTPTNNSLLALVFSTTASGAPPLLAVNYVVRETPAGTVNGLNATFVLANAPIAGKESVYLNGLLMDVGAGNDYTISGNTITMLQVPQVGDKLRVTYLK
jgi:hypothetical protein